VIKIERHLISLAEELQAAIQSQSVDIADDLAQRWFPLGLPFCGIENKGLSCNCEDLGSPDQIDPVNKYFFEDWTQAAYFASETKECRNSVHPASIISSENDVMKMTGDNNKKKNSSVSTKSPEMVEHNKITATDTRSLTCTGMTDERNQKHVGNDKDVHADNDSARKINNNIDTCKDNYLDKETHNSRRKGSAGDIVCDKRSGENSNILRCKTGDVGTYYNTAKNSEYDMDQETYNNEEKSRDESQERHSGSCRKSCCLSDSEPEEDHFAVKENRLLAPPTSDTTVNSSPAVQRSSRPRCLPDLVSFSDWMSDDQTVVAKEDSSVLRKEMKNCANLSSRGVVPCIDDLNKERGYDDADYDEEDGDLEGSSIPPRRCSRERSSVAVREDTAEVSQGKKFLIGRPDSSSKFSMAKTKTVT